MDLLTKMATYVRVVESGSFSAAAKQLRLSSPNVSRHIAMLETELKTPLLTRSTRRMAVTSQGRQYYEKCLSILRDVEAAQHLEKDDGIDGPLKVSAPVTFGLACVAPQMKTLLRKHPRLIVDLQLEDRLVDLMPEDIDVAIRVGSEPPLSTELVAHRVMTYGRALVAAPSYLKRRGAVTRPETLVRHDALMHFMAPTDTWILRHEGQEVRVHPRVVFRSNALHALLELAIEGLGVALLPEWFVAPAVAAGQLRLLLPAFRPVPVHANAVHRKVQRGAARASALVAHLRGAFANGP